MLSGLFLREGKSYVRKVYWTEWENFCTGFRAPPLGFSIQGASWPGWLPNSFYALNKMQPKKDKDQMSEQCSTLLITTQHFACVHCGGSQQAALVHICLPKDSTVHALQNESASTASSTSEEYEVVAYGSNSTVAYGKCTLGL